MRPSPPKRSLRLARLKNAHQTMSAMVKTNETIMPRPKPLIPGMRALIPNRASHWSATAATPGQTRMGLGEVMRLYTSVALKLFPTVDHKRHKSSATKKHKNLKKKFLISLVPFVDSVNKSRRGAFTLK